MEISPDEWMRANGSRLVGIGVCTENNHQMRDVPILHTFKAVSMFQQLER